MNWKYKAVLQLAFSNVPLGEGLNYFCQRYVTKSLPTNDAKFASIVSIARNHIEVMKKYYSRPLDKATFYEFGAGWNLIVPLAFYSFGVEHQILVDIRKLLRPKLINDTIKKYQRIALDMGIYRKQGSYHRDGGRQDLPDLLKEFYGIDYRAPCDARCTGLDMGSIDCITSTNTLEHISVCDIQAILRECHRLLRDDGLMSFLIDYQDHYSYFDNGISPYNFLRCSDKAWAVFSPTLHYQNRLRHRDYLDLFQVAGFEVVEERRQEGTRSDLETINRLRLARRFKAYSLSELAVRKAHIVVRKRGIGDSVLQSRPCV